MIILMILKYIYKFLKLKLLNQFYQKLLDRLNIIYIVSKIIKPKYKNLTFLIFENSKVDVIPKIRVFVDNIKDA